MKENGHIDLSAYREEYSLRMRLLRILWCVVNHTLFRLLVTKWMRIPRNALLRLFGAEVPWVSLVYSSCEIWAPWNLKLGRYACVGPHTNIYNKAPVCIGNHAVISQGAFLCTASHDISHPQLRLVSAGIEVGDEAWVAADAFIGKGVKVGNGAVVGARAAVFKDVAPWTVVGGNPAVFLKERRVVSEKTE